jgi:uncharacterized protein (TIGR03000 family)
VTYVTPHHHDHAYYRPATSTTATLLVNVPAESKVYLQDQQMTLTGPVRRYVSPSLTSGRDYVYTVRVEMERDGKLVSKTAEARVRAGAQVNVTVSLPEGGAELVADVRSAR